MSFPNTHTPRMSEISGEAKYQCPMHKVNGADAKEIVIYLKPQDNKAYFTYSSPVDNGGKYAVTHFHTLQRRNGYSLVEYKLETGRKNQIRVHSADMGHPVCGDTKYGNGDDPCNRLALHAYMLCFEHPVTHERMDFATPIPDSFLNVFK